MEHKDNDVYLLHMRDCIDRIEQYLTGYDFEKFEQNIEKIDAVVRNIEVLGEAANNLSREFRSQNPQIEWRKIIGTRNRIVHGYASVDLEIIWSITQSDLPSLKAEITALISNFDE